MYKLIYTEVTKVVKDPKLPKVTPIEIRSKKVKLLPAYEFIRGLQEAVDDFLDEGRDREFVDLEYLKEGTVA